MYPLLSFLFDYNVLSTRLQIYVSEVRPHSKIHSQNMRD